MTTITQGTIIRGTMRMVDLVPAFYDELQRLGEESIIIRGMADSVDRARALAKEGGSDQDWIEGEACRDSPGAAEWVLEHLYATLEGHAPPGMYFGPHEGASLDYGWWPVDDGEEI